MRSFIERNRFLLFFVLLTNLMGISIGMARVGTSLYSLSLGADTTLQGLIASAQSIGVIFMSIPVGFMVDRLGPWRLFVQGTILVGLLYFILPLFASAWILLGITILTSLFMPLRFVSLNTVFMSQLEKVGEAKAGWYRGSHMTGMFLIGPVIAAGTVNLLGYVGTFWLIVMLFALTIWISPAVFKHYVIKVRPESLGWRNTWQQLRGLLQDRELRSVSLIEFTGQGINAFYTFFILIIAIQLLHMDAMQATHLIGVEGATFIAALFILGGPVSRLGHERSYCISFIATLLALLALGLGSSLAWLLVSGGLLGIGLGTLQIINLTRYARLGLRLGRGRVAGISSLAGPAGSSFGCIVGGVIGQYWGLQNVFLCFTPFVAFLAWRSFANRPASILVEETI